MLWTGENKISQKGLMMEAKNIEQPQQQVSNPESSNMIVQGLALLINPIIQKQKTQDDEILSLKEADIVHHDKICAVGNSASNALSEQRKILDKQEQNIISMQSKIDEINRDINSLSTQIKKFPEAVFKAMKEVLQG